MNKTRVFFSATLSIIVLLLALSISAITPLHMAVMNSINQAAAATPDSKLAVQIDEFANKLVKMNLFSGAILVAKDGRAILSKGYGMANLDLDVPNAPRTKYRLGSITKSFTAIAVMQLQQQGKLSVKDLVCKYVDPCPEAWNAITIYHLLTHTSGLQNYMELSGYTGLKRAGATPETIIALFRDLALSFPPGKQFGYSSSNYVVLGSVIETVTGKRYGVVLQDQILKPLAMNATGLDRNQFVVKNRAEGYISQNVKADYINMSAAFASADMYSTVEDLLILDQALYTSKVLSKAQLDEMFMPAVKAEFGDGEEMYSGYGWFNDQVLSHHRIENRGGVEGFRSALHRFPDDRITVIVLSNFETVDAHIVAEQIEQLLFAQK